MTEPIYQDKAVQIFWGDCREILPTLPVADHCFTDPPYSQKTHLGARTTKGTDGKHGGKVLVDFNSINTFDLTAILKLVKIKRWLVATIDYAHIPALKCLPTLDFIRLGCWLKPDGGAPQISGDRPAMGWEPVAIMHPPGRKRWNGGGRPATWVIPSVTRASRATEKPLALIHSWIRDFTDPGETILDPFMGSGTVLRAAKDAGRKSIGIDIDREACSLAVKRMQQESLFDGKLESAPQQMELAGG